MSLGVCQNGSIDVMATIVSLEIQIWLMYLERTDTTQNGHPDINHFFFMLRISMLRLINIPQFVSVHHMIGWKMVLFQNCLAGGKSWRLKPLLCHYNDVIMGTIATLIANFTIVYSTVYSDADQRKHQSSAALAFVHRGPVNILHNWPVTRKMFPFHDAIMVNKYPSLLYVNQYPDVRPSLSRSLN